ncbi:hypothetical protein ACFL6C_14130 [Myxococcota bacterium]
MVELYDEFGEQAIEDFKSERLQSYYRAYPELAAPAIGAWARADELRRGVLDRLVFKAPGQYGALREAVRAHLVMQGDLVRVSH